MSSWWCNALETGVFGRRSGVQFSRILRDLESDIGELGLRSLSWAGEVKARCLVRRAVTFDGCWVMPSVWPGEPGPGSLSSFFAVL